MIGRMAELYIFTEDGSGPGWSNHAGGVHDDLPGGQEDDPVLLLH